MSAFNQTSSLRGAAALLGVDPPSLVRKVRTISEEYGYLQKVGNRWAITETGRKVAQWADEVILGQSALVESKQSLRIASFAWLGEEMLVPQFPELQKTFGAKYSWSFNMTATDTERELLRGRADFVVQGHAPMDPSIAYKKILSYPWVVVLPTSWQKDLARKRGEELRDFLRDRPFIRHAQVNPEEALGFKLRTISDLSVDCVVGLRAAVVSGLGWSVVPRMAAQSLLRQKSVLRLDLPTNIKDEVSVWWLRSRKDVARAAPAVCRWIAAFPVL